MKKIIISIVGTACVACAIGAALITNVTNEYEQKLNQIVDTYEQEIRDMESVWEDDCAKYENDMYELEEELIKYINDDAYEINFEHDGTYYRLREDKKSNNVFDYLFE